MGTMGGKKTKSVFSVALMYMPLNIVFRADKQGTALNCPSSYSELGFSLISQHRVTCFEKTPREKTVLVIQIISYNKNL